MISERDTDRGTGQTSSPTEHALAELQLCGFRAFEVVGPLDFSLVGVLAGYLTPLARAAIPVFVLSTFDTDWILVRQERLEAAVAALEQAGIEISRADSGAWAPDRPPAPARP